MTGMAAPRLSKVLTPAATVLAAACLAGCGGAVSSVISSLKPSVRPSVNVSIPTLKPPQPSATAVAPAPPPATTAASTPAGGSSLAWLWVALGLLVLIVVIFVIVRASGRRSAKSAGWQQRMGDAYARGAALHDSMQLAESPGALNAADAPGRWLDIQRRADDLAQELYALQENAPGEDERARVADVLGALQAVRSTMAAERTPEGIRIPPERIRSRLMSFEMALRALRTPDPYRS